MIIWTSIRFVLLIYSYDFFNSWQKLDINEPLDNSCFHPWQWLLEQHMQHLFPSGEICNIYFKVLCRMILTRSILSILWLGSLEHVVLRVPIFCPGNTSSINMRSSMRWLLEAIISVKYPPFPADSKCTIWWMVIVQTFTIRFLI